MFEIRQVRELKARKALLISECALERSLIAQEALLFERKTRWTTLLYTGFQALLPRLNLLLPLAGWAAGRLFFRGSRGGRRKSSYDVVGLVRKGVVAWQLFKRARALWTEWRERREISRLRSLN